MLRFPQLTYLAFSTVDQTAVGLVGDDFRSYSKKTDLRTCHSAMPNRRDIRQLSLLLLIRLADIQSQPIRIEV